MTVSAQLHRATSLCIQLLDKENNDVNNKAVDTTALFQNSTVLYRNLYFPL